MSEDEQLRLQEYTSLCFDLRSRREYLNKLNAGFITYTTAVVTIAFALFSFVGNLIDMSVELEEKITALSLSKSLEQQELLDYYFLRLSNIKVSIMSLQFFQALLNLSPVVYSKICFNHALENNVRISLISDYLERVNTNNNLISIRHKY